MSSARRPGEGLGQHRDLRRVDWRFLLPSPRPASVAVVGPPGQALLDGLALVADRVVEVEEARPGAELAVVVDPSEPALARAVRAVRPGGWVYVEVDRRGERSGIRSSRSCARALRRLGCVDVRRYWHWPSFEGCLEIVDLDSNAAVSMSLARRRASSSATVKAMLARGLQGLGVMGDVVPCASVVARREDETPARAGRPIGLLGVAGPGAALERLGIGAGAASILVTPRFETSRAVVALLAPPGRATPTAVAKIARVPAEGSAIERESQNLAALGLEGAFDGTVPGIVWTGQVDGWPVLVTTALTGSMVNPRFVRRHRRAVVEAGLDWVLGLARSRSCPAGARVERLVDGPLQRLAAVLPGDRALERTRAVLAPLRAARLPVVFEHGDVSHPNLFWLPGGRLGVIDWELAEPEGLPVADLVFFLAYVASADAGVTAPGEHRAAFERAFVAPEGWGLEVLRRYARATGVGEEAIRPLAVACFARYTAGLGERAGRPEAAAGTPGEADWTRGSRAYALWQAALTWAEA